MNMSRFFHFQLCTVLVLLAMGKVFIASEHYSSLVSTISGFKNPPSCDKQQSRTLETKLDEYYPNEPMPACAKPGKQADSWLMLFMGHSGSSAIYSQLSQHPQVITANKPEAVDHLHYEFNSSAALNFTSEFFEKAASPQLSPGFKLRFWHPVNYPGKWAQLAARYNTRILWNYRENLFKKALGEYKRIHLNDTTVIEGLRSNLNVTERCKYTKCTFAVRDIDAFYKLLRRMALNERLVTKAVENIDNGRGCVLPVPYESYLYHTEATMKRVHEFLGLPIANFTPTRFKATPDNLCELVENWDELCAKFYSCLAWRRMMRDMRNNCTCRNTIASDKYCDVY